MTRPTSAEAGVASHYASSGLLDAIEAGLATMGVSPSRVTVEDLAPVDEFHVGGRQATTELCEQLQVTPGSELLDVGCGIGGTARLIASTFGCRVTGLDLTPDYLEVARTLTEWTSLGDRLRFELGSAVDMPFVDGAFDGATQLHVGMNIADKETLFAEVYRVLRPGSRFAVYDIMRVADGEIAFPVPWATDETTSFVEDLPTYRRALETVGFGVALERDRREYAVEFFARLRDRIASRGGPPPLGLHIIMGPDAPQKIANMVSAVNAGILSPIELIARKPAA